MNVVPKTQRLLQLEDLRANLLDGGSLRLFQNDLVPDENSLLADFTVATFDGYANKTVATWGAVYLDPAGLATTLAPLQTWTQTGIVTPNTVYGMYYLDANGDLCYAERFASPLSFGAVDTVFNMVPKFQLGEIAAP